MAGRRVLVIDPLAIFAEAQAQYLRSVTGALRLRSSAGAAAAAD